MTTILLLGALTLLGSIIGTATGFGTSTVMIPVLTGFLPLPVALLFVGAVHLCGDIWKVVLFKRGFDWKLVLGFGLSGIVASYAGASLSFAAGELPLKRLLGGFLVFYVAFLLTKRKWTLPKNHGTSVCGGALSGLCAGFFGVGGAVRGAFLTAFDLPKDVYIFTSGLIALFIDVTRVSRYLAGGTRLGLDLVWAMAICIPISFGGAYVAKRFLARVPQESFRVFVGVFLALVGLKLLLGF